jgi:hypothetical protein
VARLTILRTYSQVGSPLAGLFLLITAVLTTQGQAMPDDETSRSKVDVWWQDPRFPRLALATLGSYWSMVQWMGGKAVRPGAS